MLEIPFIQKYPLTVIMLALIAGMFFGLISGANAGKDIACDQFKPLVGVGKDITYENIDAWFKWVTYCN